MLGSNTSSVTRFCHGYDVVERMMPIEKEKKSLQKTRRYVSHFWINGLWRKAPGAILTELSTQ